MANSAQITVKDERQITLPNGGLDLEQTRHVTEFFVQIAQEGYALKAVAARQKDIGSQRDPYVVTEAVVLTFQKAT